MKWLRLPWSWLLVLWYGLGFFYVFHTERPITYWSSYTVALTGELIYGFYHPHSLQAFFVVIPLLVGAGGAWLTLTGRDATGEVWVFPWGFGPALVSVFTGCVFGIGGLPWSDQLTFLAVATVLQLAALLQAVVLYGARWWLDRRETPVQPPAEPKGRISAVRIAVVVALLLLARRQVQQKTSR